MKILFLSSFISRSDGSNALVRLIEGMKMRGHECIALSYPGGQKVKGSGYISLNLNKDEEDKDRKYIEIEKTELPWMHRPSGSMLIKKIDEIKPDIINIHWTHGPNFIPLDCLPALSEIAPLFWTLHDMWPFTGNCFYSNGCDSFKNGCDVCERDLTDVDIAYPQQKRYTLKAKSLWETKKAIYNKFEGIHFIAPSVWMKKMASEASSVKGKEISVIPNGVPTKIFLPSTDSRCRDQLKIPENAFVILLSSVSLSDPRKGYDLFIKSIKRIITDKEIIIIALGQKVDGIIKQTSFRVIGPGLIKTYQEMAEFYSIADLYILPTRADNLPSTILESLSCGLPIVSFDVGGISDMITKDNGYLARPEDEVDLARGIMHFINKTPEDLEIIKLNNRSRALDLFTITKQAEAYDKIFQCTINNQKNS